MRPARESTDAALRRSVLGSLVVVALVASVGALAAVIIDEPDTVATGGTTAAVSAEPGFAFADASDPNWKPRDPIAPPSSGLPAGTVHQVVFEATEEQVEIAPGVEQLMWTFNGTMPGPTLRGRVGDVFEITIVNKGSLGHSIDFHARYCRTA